MFMYDEINKNTNSQTNSSTKHILNTYECAHKMKSIVIR